MKTAIIYYSRHHGNTAKLLRAISEKHSVTLIDINENPVPDLSEYDRIGLASGIYYSKFGKKLLRFAEESFPDGKETFFIFTYGAKKEGYTDAVAQAVRRNNAKICGEYGCFGFNTFGPFKLIGGIAKGHPDGDEIAAAVSFYETLDSDLK